MRELLEIVAAYESLVAAGKPCALATVIGTQGSSYRRPGARMLIAEDGRTWGCVSGGCLERDVVQRALGVIASGSPMLHRYETTDDEQLASASTGCGGAVEVLIQPMALEFESVIGHFQSVLAERRPAQLVTIVRASGDWRAWTGRTLLAADLPEAFDASARVFRETIEPPQELVIFGAGPDVAPLLEIAKTLGWHVTVVAAPPATHLAERLQRADRLLINGANDVCAGIEIHERSAVLVMTHNIARDRSILENLRTAPAYLGLLGPRHRTLRVMEGLPWSFEDESVFAPVGLDIGGESPDQIAAAIVAEIVAWRNGRPGGNLRDSEFIHGTPVSRVVRAEAAR